MGIFSNAMFIWVPITEANTTNFISYCTFLKYLRLWFSSWCPKCLPNETNFTYFRACQNYFFPQNTTPSFTSWKVSIKSLLCQKLIEFLNLEIFCDDMNSNWEDNTWNMLLPKRLHCIFSLYVSLQKVWYAWAQEVHW